MITATRIKDSVSGIAVLQTGNSGVAVLTDMDELVLVVRVVAVVPVETCVSVMSVG